MTLKCNSLLGTYVFSSGGDIGYTGLEDEPDKLTYLIQPVLLINPTSLPRFQTISISAWEIGWKLPSLLILHTISFHSMDMLDVDMASYFVSCRYVGVAIKLTRSVLIIFRI